MYNTVIEIDPSAPNLELADVWIGQGSNGRVLVRNVPRLATAVRFVLTPVGSSGTQAYYGVYNAVTHDWVVTLPGWAFPTVGPAAFEVTFSTGADATLETFSSGGGTLHVYASAMSAEIPDAPDVSTELIVTDPVTGKRYILVALVNSVGEPSPALTEKV